MITAGQFKIPVAPLWPNEVCKTHRDRLLNGKRLAKFPRHEASDRC